MRLTDPPAVVDLKRQFRELVEHAEALQPFQTPGLELAELQAVRRAQTAIASEISAAQRSTPRGGFHYGKTKPDVADDDYA